MSESRVNASACAVGLAESYADYQPAQGMCISPDVFHDHADPRVYADVVGEKPGYTPNLLPMAGTKAGGMPGLSWFYSVPDKDLKPTLTQKSSVSTILLKLLSDPQMQKIIVSVCSGNPVWPPWGYRHLQVPGQV